MANFDNDAELMAILGLAVPQTVVAHHSVEGEPSLDNMDALLEKIMLEPVSKKPAEENSTNASAEPV